MFSDFCPQVLTGGALERPSLSLLPFASITRANIPTHTGARLHCPPAMPSVGVVVQAPAAERGSSSDPATQQLTLWSSLPMNNATYVLWTIGMVTVTILYIQGTDCGSPGVDPGLQAFTFSLCVDPGILA